MTVIKLSKIIQRHKWKSLHSHEMFVFLMAVPEHEFKLESTSKLFSGFDSSISFKHNVFNKCFCVYVFFYHDVYNCHYISLLTINKNNCSCVSNTHSRLVFEAHVLCSIFSLCFMSFINLQIYKIASINVQIYRLDHNFFCTLLTSTSCFGKQDRVSEPRSGFRLNHLEIIRSGC